MSTVSPDIQNKTKSLSSDQITDEYSACNRALMMMISFRMNSITIHEISSIFFCLLNFRELCNSTYTFHICSVHYMIRHDKLLMTRWSKSLKVKFGQNNVRNFNFLE